MTPVGYMFNRQGIVNVRLTEPGKLESLVDAGLDNGAIDFEEHGESGEVQVSLSDYHWVTQLLMCYVFFASLCANHQTWQS
jgi:transcriptional/translational regulatory protein YebC/TACO1